VSNVIWSSPAVADDGTVYVGHNGYTDGNLLAINPDGTLKWSYPAREVRSAPAIAPDGTIYVGASDARLYAINPNGSLKWAYQTGFKESYSSPAIGADGTIYIAGAKERNLHAVNPGGTTKWTYPIGGDTTSSPTIDDNGIIYIGGADNKLYALNPNGTLKWSYTVGIVVSHRQSAAIGPYGTIYIISRDRILYAFTPSGDLKWTYTYITGEDFYTTPAVDANGVIYFGARDGKVYAINPDSSEKWIFQTPADKLLSSIAVNSDGTLYVSGVGGIYAIGTVPVVQAELDLDPDTLNLKSRDKWITAYIELPDGYDVADIDVGTVTLEGTIAAEDHPTELGDYDDDGTTDLMVKFDRQALIEYLDGTIGEVALTVSGELSDGTLFEGSDTITVINPGKK
jgi:outer membrane protein assembly factor BamB